MNTNTPTQHPPVPPSAAHPPLQQFGGPEPLDQNSNTFGELPQKEVSPLRKVADEIRETAAETAHSAKEAGVGFVAQQKEKLATCIDQYSGGLKSVCEGLQNDDKSALAAPAKKAAGQLQRTATYLRNREPIDMYHDLEDFARRRPEVAYGALFFAGLAAVRFLKSSARNPQSA